ncbi:MAG: MerR family transcriptional regulator [Pseudomonadota bacterium]|nr:MerR family transcriptional regulator [Pseudomonadota bacterium]
MQNTEYFASINEVSKQLGIPAHTLRYWERQFPVAIKPTTGAGGRRYYRTETVARLTVIRDLLYTRGMTIAGVKKLLRDGTFPDTASALNIAPTPAAATVAPSAPTPQNHTDEIDTAIDLLLSAKQLLTVAQ